MFDFQSWHRNTLFKFQTDESFNFSDSTKNTESTNKQLDNRISNWIVPWMQYCFPLNILRKRSQKINHLDILEEIHHTYSNHHLDTGVNKKYRPYKINVPQIHPFQWLLGLKHIWHTHLHVSSYNLCLALSLRSGCPKFFFDTWYPQLCNGSVFHPMPLRNHKEKPTNKITQTRYIYQMVRKHIGGDDQI